MVDHTQMRVRYRDSESPVNEPGKSLGRRVFIGEVHIAVKKHGGGVDTFDGVRSDDFFVERLGHGLSPGGSCFL